MGMPINMMWPMVQENLGKLCTDKKMQGLTLSIESEGLRVTDKNGLDKLILPDATYEEVSEIIEGVLNE